MLVVAALVWLAGPPKLPPFPGERPPPPLPEQYQPKPKPKPEPEPEPLQEEPAGDIAGPDAPVDRASDVHPPPAVDTPRAPAKPVVLANGPNALQPAVLPRRAPAWRVRKLEPASGDELARLAGPPEPAPGPGGADTEHSSKNPGDRPRSTRAGTVHRDAYIDDVARLEAQSPARPPRRTAAFVFGYRLFQTKDAFARPQSWHVGSVDVTPLRRYVRLNLVTEFGWEGGPAARNGDRADFFLMQKAGLGVQYPHWVTPFIEFQGGAGAMRVELFDRSDLLLLYTFGVDVGAQWAIARWMRLHASIGWIRPIVRRPEYSVRHDSFTFKVGVGF